MSSRSLSVNELFRLEYVIYATAFLIPLILRHPQPVVGTVVNTLLFISAAKLQGKHLIPLAIIPNVSALLNGALFGGLTPFLLYFLPFIWVGNLLLMTIFRYLRTNGWIRIIASAVAKSAFLYLSALILINYQVVPKAFLVAMGPVQLGTALGGGVIALGVLQLLDRRK